MNAAGVPGDLIHALLPSNMDVGLLYLDSESNSAHELMQHFAGLGLSGEIWCLPNNNGPGIRCAFEQAVAARRLLKIRRTGMPLRPYLRWLRLQRSAVSIIAGSSATESAHGAGFADAAHLSRTFSRHFGIAPSMLARLAAT